MESCDHANGTSPCENNSISRQFRRCAVTALIALLSVCASGLACAQPVLKAVVADPAPVIDGDLSDACWQQAPSVTDFCFPADGTEAPEATTAWLCYDQQNIYLAFCCKDSQPDKISAQQKKRGGDIDTDDWVGFDLDCYGDYSRIVWFDATAGGVQVESLQSGDVSKIEWKGDWAAEAQRVDDGYIVEIAVPFSILQYHANQTSMGIAFIRRHARMDQWWWSPNVGPNSDPRRFYLWDGLELPKPDTRPLILGYSLLTAGEGDEGKRLGLDIKHAFSPNLMGLMTFNPDFRNVEQEVDSVDFSYTERQLSDSRPFFQEGSGYFPSSHVFYSRRIADMDAGGKMYGRIGDFSLAFAHARKFDEEDYTVFQIGREWPARGELRFGLVESNAPGVNNAARSMWGSYTFYDRNDRDLRLDTRLISADSLSGSGSGEMTDFHCHWNVRPRELGARLGYRAIDPDFDPYLGYVPEKDLRAWDFDLSVYDERSEGRISEWDIDLSASLVDRMDGSLYYNSLGLHADCEWRNGTSAYIGIQGSHRPPFHDRRVNASYSWGRRDLYKNGYVGLGIGKMAGGDYIRYTIGQGWNINHKLSTRCAYEYSRIKEPSPEAYSAGQLIWSVAYDVDDERTLGGRLVASGGKANFYLAYKQRVRAGLDAYVIVGDPNAESTRSSLTLKLVRPL